MAKCPIQGCTKETEYFLTFIIKSKIKDDDRVSKSLVGCYCSEHAYELKDDYEDMGRIVELLPEKKTREISDARRKKADDAWGKGKRERKGEQEQEQNQNNELE